MTDDKDKDKGKDELPRPDWQDRVWARIDRPSWWRRLLRWLSW